jgi:hypothetical protein
MWFFRGCSPCRNYDTTPRHTWLILCTLQTTLDSTVQWSCMNLDHWFYCNLPGETLVENSKTHGTSSNFNKVPTYVNCTRRFTICNSNRHISETSSTSCRAIQREKGIDRQWPERRKMSEEKEKAKSLQVAGTLVPRQKAIGCCAREKGASKSHLVRRWKTQSALRDATFLLPSVCCRVLRCRVFILWNF